MVAGSSPGASLIGRMRTSRSAFGLQPIDEPPSRGAVPAAAEHRAGQSCESSRASAAARGTPVAAKGSSGARAARIRRRADCTAASSGANGSPRSTAARSATATKARRPALSAPGRRRRCALRPILAPAPARRRARQAPRSPGGRRPARPARAAFFCAASNAASARLSASRAAAFARVDPRAELGERPHRGFERGDARGERLIGLRARGGAAAAWPTPCSALPSRASRSASRPIACSAAPSACTEIRERARIGRRRLRPAGESRAPAFPGAASRAASGTVQVVARG